jgi:hypothetical protein
MSRRQRRFVAWLGLAGIVFAQIAVSAHACMLRVQTVAPAAAAALPHHGHCGGDEQQGVPLAPQGNACELQCSEAAPSTATPDLPPIDFASAPILFVAPAALQPVTRALGRSFLAADIAAPPRSLFCRLLN